MTKKISMLYKLNKSLYNFKLYRPKLNSMIILLTLAIAALSSTIAKANSVFDRTGNQDSINGIDNESIDDTTATQNNHHSTTTTVAKLWVLNL